MKILLLGEFSGFHMNLKEGLQRVGYDVQVASTGDGWKNIDKDILLPQRESGAIGQTRYRVKMYQALAKIEGYDVVQIVNPFIMPMKFFPRFI